MRQVESPALRLLFLLLYVGLLFVVNWMAFGRWVPFTDGRSLWLAAGFLNLLLSTFLVTPYFERPANYIASSSASVVAVWLALDWQGFERLEKYLSVSVIAYLLVVCAAASVAVLLGRTRSERAGRVGTSAKIVADSIGTDRFLFTIVILFAVSVFHRGDPGQTFWILAAWSVIILLRPEAYLVALVSRLRRVWAPSGVEVARAEIAGYDDPGVVLLRQHTDSAQLGDVLLVNDSLTKPCVAQAVGYVGRDRGMLLRARMLRLDESMDRDLKKLASDLPLGTAAAIVPDESLMVAIRRNKFAARCSELVGLVAANTSINKLNVELGTDVEMAEGTIVEANIAGKPVLYQIVDGLTREEIVFQKNTRGFACAEARKIGCWADGEKKFKHAKWIPSMHSPVYRSRGPARELDHDDVGCLPETNFPVTVASVHELVTYNTAILGILGVGKSFLALELVERLFAEGVKVVCLDLTDQYAKELEPFYDFAGEARCIEKIRQAGDRDRGNVQDGRADGGSIENLRQAIKDDLSSFLSDDCDAKLKIYNPGRLTASIQYADAKSKKVGDDWVRVAPFRETTPVEVTRIVTEACLELLHDKMRDMAKVCLVFEEAHSLVPEFSNVTVDSDKYAVAGTARAILQGRKYGMGCFLITQRTANVTKTILNQCNTIFAFRTFDDTGMAFLENYLGRGYAHILPSLEDRHAVFFGRGSNCENPVLMRVNDRVDFHSRFREVHRPPADPPAACEGNEENEGEPDVTGEASTDQPF